MTSLPGILRRVAILTCWAALVALSSARAQDAGKQNDDAPADAELTTSRDLLALYGVDTARFDHFADGSDVGDDEREPLLRVLNAARRLTFGDWYRWLQDKLPWSTWNDDPSRVRGDIYKVKGRAKRVTRVDLPDDLAERFDLKHYYRCELSLADEQSAVVYALAVPKAWKLDEPIDEPSGAKGIFVKLASTGPDKVVPMFVAARAAWFPDTELGHLGFDVGLFDTVVDRTPLETSDSDCFYELMAAAAQTKTGELLNRTSTLSREQATELVIDLFNRPEQQHGRLAALTGTASRVVEIKIENPEVVQALGIDRYYEIELVNVDTKGNPIAFLLHELPKDMPRGEQVSVDIRVPGFFYKVWSYPLKVKVDGKAQVQMAPMLIGNGLHLLPREVASTWFSTIVTGLLLGGIAVIGLALWWLNRSDRRAKQRLRGPATSVDVRLDDLANE
jgi:hypothetical protein